MTKDEKEKRIGKLRQQVASCLRCPLGQTRINAVLGEGSIDARVMLIGEAPGKNEDMQGRPFVGRAGDILDALLESAQLTREQVYICNILKCRPPNNRNPSNEEILACVGSLDIQLQVINPPIIGTLGNFATAYIFQKFSIPLAKISQVHGKIFKVDGPLGPKIVIPLFHPAVVTYNGQKMAVLLKDFQVLKKM
ncbi:MAG: uracil-DNA glycosylase [Candidatus Omnitrophota bacterium]